MFGNTFVMSLVFGSMNRQKSAGNVMQPVEMSTKLLSFPMSGNSFENTSPYWSFCNSTCMFILNLSFLTCFHKTDDFKDALRSSAGVDRGITGNVWRNHLSTESSHHQPGFEWFVDLASFGLMPAKIFYAPLFVHSKLSICISANVWSSHSFTKGCTLFNGWQLERWISSSPTFQ